MSEQAVVNLSDGDRRALFLEAQKNTGMVAEMIEKDFWVCWILRHLFDLPGAKDHFIFKGGTSLSKVWRVIQRFSEDIDISLSREWLGFTGARDPEQSKGKQRKRLLGLLSEACAARLQGEVTPALQGLMQEQIGGRWSLETNPHDAQTLLFAYPTVFETTAAPYVRRIVKIECGARSDRWPVSVGRVTSYVAEAFPDKLTDAGIDVPVLSIERTFWEKASILHAEAHRPLEKMIPDRYSRHYADVAALANTASGDSAIQRDDLRARVVAHKQVFFPAVWSHTETAVPGTFGLCRRRSAQKFLPVTTPKCATCSSVNRRRGPKFSMCWRPLKDGSTPHEIPRIPVDRAGSMSSLQVVRSLRLMKIED